MINLNKLTTEASNTASRHIDQCTTLQMLQIINQEDKKVAYAIEKILPQIADAIDCITMHLKNDGRLFYLGAGTSGRLGILDAVECPPTYGTAPDLVQGIIAGGYNAIFKSREGTEDSEILAAQDLQEHGFSPKDVLVGIAASGRTPYVIGGLKHAKALGAATISLACTPDSIISGIADCPLTVITGPEIITGSTRMKAGTAQKLILNMLSTATMIQLGKVYGNLMVDVKASNKKLEERACHIVMESTGCSHNEASEALTTANGSAKLAIFHLLSGEPFDNAKKLLTAADGYIGKALHNLSKGAGSH
jgi:N-acetylmuramic acid 6-phosphate etherase